MNLYRSITTSELFYKHIYKNFYKIKKIKNKCHNKTVFLIYFTKKDDRNIIFDYLELELLDKIASVFYSKKRSDIFICLSKLGSPAVAIQVENLAYLGFKNIIHIGIAGSFCKEIKIGTFVLAKGAYAESIIPYIYNKRKFSFDPDSEKNDENNWFLENIFEVDKHLSKILKKNLEDNNIIYFEKNIFSTDFLYRENQYKFLKLKEKDSCIVEMEGASIFSVSDYFNIKSAALYIVSDILVDEKWEMEFKSDLLIKNYEKIKKLLLNFKFHG